jgi:hypothetical protein
MVGNEDESDPESVAYVNSEPRSEEVDFDEPLWLIEIHYWNTVTQHIVNAATKQEARDAALMKASREGEMVLNAERIYISHVESLEGGDSNSS